MKSTMLLERWLQKQRFKIAMPYLEGDLLDFGANQGELGLYYTKGRYTGIDKDYKRMKGKKFDTIVCLAVIEHIEEYNVVLLFKDFREMLKDHGRIFITTPTRLSKRILEMLAKVGLLDKENLAEHKHYWTKLDLIALAIANDLKMIEHKRFQFGLNQYAVFKAI